MSIRKTITRNTTFNAAGRVWEALSSFVLAAYVVERLGLRAWGLWALLSVFTGYVALLDFGLGSGFAKFVAEHAARKEKRAISEVVSTGFFAYLLLGAVMVAVGWPCVDILVGLVSKLRPGVSGALAEGPLSGDVEFLLRGSLLLFAASNCAAAFTSVQTGLQRMGITNALSFGASLLKIGATVAFIEGGHGVRGLLYANGVVLAFFAGASVLVAFYLAPGLRVSPRYITKAAFDRLFAFGWRTQVSKLSNLVMFQTDRAVVGLVYGQLGLVGVYRIGEELAGKMRQAPALLVTALMPAAADLDARGDAERLQRLYVLSSKYVAVVTIPLVAFTVGAAGPIMRAWMGSTPGLDTAAWVCRILAVGYLANIIPGAGVSVALGKGRPDIQMKAGLISMTANIAFTVILVSSVGFYGIPLGTALSTFVSASWFMAAMRSLVGVSLAELVRRTMFWPLVASLPGLAGCLAAGAWTAGVDGRVPNLMVVGASAAGFGVCYGILITFTPYLTAFDVEFLENTLRLRYIPGFSWWKRWARLGEEHYA